MRRARIFSAALGLVCMTALVAPPRVHARRGGFLIMGAGETISHVVDADLSSDPELAATLGFDAPAIGYKYEYFSLFFIDFWTGGGVLVLYDQSGDRYVPLRDDLCQQLTGRSPDSFGSPFLYKVPLGWIVLGVLAAMVGVSMWRRMRELP